MMASTQQGNITARNRQLKIENLKVVLLAGGVGGAKMADGFAQLLPPENLAVIVNTGDDFIHCGLTICPDLDTVMYTLAGQDSPDTGWGRVGESWTTMEEVGRLDGPNWFSLGDLDLGTHLTRSHLLSEGKTLTEASQHLCSRLGIENQVLPMSDRPAPTMMETDEGLLPFQTWFVEKQWLPVVHAVRLPQHVKSTSQVTAVLERADLVVLAPSNPFVSIDPVLNVYPIRTMIGDLPRLVMAISPIIAGKAVKGPAAKMMAEMNLPVTSGTVAGHYGDLIDLFVYDRLDSDPPDGPDLMTYESDILMSNRADRRRLALELINHTMELIKQ
jgi:LPPG:FO 2-phospho-L-lactate transferase